MQLADNSNPRMAPPPAQVSVIAPIQPAIERARRLLFQPFDFARWFAIGFCAWLARLGAVGFNGFHGLRWFNGFDDDRLFTPPNAPRGSSWQGSFELWETQVKTEVVANLYWVVPLAVALVCLVVALWLLMTWLGSRGEFMFLHCVALDRAEVQLPWRRYAREARSLFLFRLALGLIAALPILLLLAVIVVIVVWIVKGDSPLVGAEGPLLIVAGLALLAVGLGFVVVAKLTQDLVVPIMFLRRGTPRQAWGELLGLFAGRLNLLIVYLLFQIVLGMAIGAVVLVAVIATCCIAGCLLLLPYLGTVALLPVLVFQRAYSVYYLGQLGAPYDLFQATAPSPPSPA